LASRVAGPACLVLKSVFEAPNDDLALFHDCAVPDEGLHVRVESGQGAAGLVGPGALLHL
jgi:hypothetical protein